MRRNQSRRPRQSALQIGCALLLLATLPACSESPTAAETVTWATTADTYRGQNGERVRYACPANGVAHPIWGVDLYTDDSSVCTAAVHAGKITLPDGGTVTFEVRPGEASYAASTRNGITSGTWPSWLGSFVFP